MADFQHSRHAEPWDGTDRRVIPREPVHVENPNTPVTKEYLDHALTEWKQASRAYFNGKFEEMDARICDGFPDGDTRAHREVHERFIKRAEDNANMWKALRDTTIKGIVWAALCFVGLAILDALKILVQK